MIIAILTGALEVPKWFVLLNPVGALPILLIARKLNIKVGGAMGIGFTFYGIVLIVAGVAALMRAHNASIIIRKDVTCVIIHNMKGVNMYLVFSILGLIGGLLCCVGDVLFDLKGKGNEKLGTSKNIDSNWVKMADWRFGLSIAFALVGDAMVGLGFYSIGMQIAETHSLLGYLTIGFGYFGSMAGIFIHSFVCIQALIYKGALINGRLQIADDILEKLPEIILIIGAQKDAVKIEHTVG